MATVLGLPGPWARDSKEASDHYTTKIGGFPDWPMSQPQFRSQLVECNLCKCQLCLVAQIYAPVKCKSSRIDERMLYIFCCRSPHCEQSPFSWKALRIQKPYNEDESVDSSQGHASSFSESVLNSGEDGGFEMDEDMDLEELALALSEATLSASSTKKKRPNTCNRYIGSGSLPHLPCFYTYIVEEQFSRRNRSPVLKYEGFGDSENEEWGEEGYEHDTVIGVDRVYLKFKKRLDAYPEQCFRYGGNPLLATRGSYVPGNCELCGGERRYEMQLMPPLLYFLLEVADDEQKVVLDRWNWMSIVVYTCSNSCFGDDGGWTIAEETLFVELESPIALHV